MLQMFDNIASLQLGKDNQDRDVATAMISCEGEVLEFTTSIFAEGRVEDWMTNVLNEMRKSNHKTTKKAIYDYGKVRRPRYVFEKYPLFDFVNYHHSKIILSYPNAGVNGCWIIRAWLSWQVIRCGGLLKWKMFLRKSRKATRKLCDSILNK